MDENCYAEMPVVTMPETLLKDGIFYSHYCSRDERHQADCLSEDLKQSGYNSIVTWDIESNVYHVWWVK